jgi:PAS domain S-box-containing protein
MRSTSSHVPPPLGSASGDERRYRALFDDALLGIYFSRPHGGLVNCNAAFARMVGFESPAEAIGADMSFVYTSPDQREKFYQHLQQHGRLEYMRGPMRRRDGRIIEVITTVVASFDAQGNLDEFRGFVFDITASAGQSAALKARERQFRSVFVDAADAMLILDDNRQVLEANRAACELFGLSEDALRSRTLDALIVSEAEPLAAAWRELMAIGEARREHRLICEGRSPRRLEASYRADVEAGRHLLIARDVTDRRMLEERLVQSERNESVGRLAGGIAHDFNNLLTAILGYTDLLLADRPPDDAARADLVEIQKAGQRAANLTQKLLAYGRKQVMVPKEVDLNEAVAGLDGMLKRLVREDITLIIEREAGPALVRIDPTQFEQVILNLVLNAREAMPGGGTIRIQVAKVDLSPADVPSDQTLHATEYVRLRIVDDGVGMTPDVRAHLFEPFFTTKGVGKGSGLGLASVYGIVRQSSGFISVESEPGRGSAFTMHFPALSPAPAAGGGAADLPAAGGARETILLVEDEDAVRTIVGAVLRRQGYQILEAATAKAACDIFDRHGGEVDLLLTDVVMPEMNGPALAQRLVALRPELRVLFISGYSDVSPLDPSNPNMSFLGKPFQASVLAAKVREVLSRRRHSK